MEVQLFIQANLTSVPVISFLLITLKTGAAHRKQCRFGSTHPTEIPSMV